MFEKEIDGCMMVKNLVSSPGQRMDRQFVQFLHDELGRLTEM